MLIVELAKLPMIIPRMCTQIVCYKVLWFGRDDLADFVRLILFGFREIYRRMTVHLKRALLKTNFYNLFLMVIPSKCKADGKWNFNLDNYEPRNIFKDFEYRCVL